MGLGKKLFWIMVGASLWGCAFTATFPYHWYGTQLESYKGKLIGPTDADNLDFEKECAPDDVHKQRCSVFLDAELKRLQIDHEQLQIDLNACQHALASAMAQ